MARRPPKVEATASDDRRSLGGDIPCTAISVRRVDETRVGGDDGMSRRSDGRYTTLNGRLSPSDQGVRERCRVFCHALAARTVPTCGMTRVPSSCMGEKVRAGLSVRQSGRPRQSRPCLVDAVPGTSRQRRAWESEVVMLLADRPVEGCRPAGTGAVGDGRSHCEGADCGGDSGDQPGGGRGESVRLAAHGPGVRRDTA